jgi:hypothetical protein
MNPLTKPLSKLTQEERRAKKFELLDCLEEPHIKKERRVIISRKRMLTNKGDDGEYNPNTKEIVINPDRSVEESIAIYVHENLHFLLPDATERFVTTLEAYIVKELTVEEKRVLFRLMAAEADWDD